MLWAAGAMRSMKVSAPLFAANVRRVVERNLGGEAVSPDVRSSSIS
jgi:hypothetical protein